MQRKLLKAAIGAALAASASLAQAGVTVGGQAQVEYYHATAECSIGTGFGFGAFSGSGMCTAGNPLKHNVSGLIDNARGRFFIAADEDIGSLKALARYEFSVDTANSGQTAANGNSSLLYDATVRGFDNRTREKYVGLSGGFGTFTFGNLHGVYKRMGGVRWDPLNATVLEARGNGGQSGGDLSAVYAHNGFIPGAIKWESDKLMGNIARLEAMFAPDRDEPGVGTGNFGNGYDYQLGVSIKPIKQLEIVVAHSMNKEQTNLAGVEDAKATKLGVRGIFGGSTAFAQYEMADITSSTASTGSAVGIAGVATPAADGKWLLLGFSQKIGSSDIVAQVGRHDRDRPGVSAATLGSDAFYYAAAYVFNFSKTAKVWAGARKTDADSGTVSRETMVYSAGMRKDF